MEKKRRGKGLLVLGLTILLLGTTLGFAAFSARLNISSSATVSPNEEDFRIVVSGSDSDSAIYVISPETIGGAVAEDITVTNTNSGSSASLNVGFSKPGQSVTYQFYVHNVGEYDAFLKNIIFKNVLESSSKKLCNVVDGSEATVELVNKACEDIEISVDLQNGSEFVNYKDDMTFESMKLTKGSISSGKFNIVYPEGAARADGEFNIQFGDIELSYSTAG